MCIIFYLHIKLNSIVENCKKCTEKKDGFRRERVKKSGVCLLIYYLFCNLSTYYLNNQIYLKHFILLRAVSFDGVYQFSSDVHCIAPCWVRTLRSLIALNSRIVWRVLLHIFATPFFFALHVFFDVIILSDSINLLYFHCFEKKIHFFVHFFPWFTSTANAHRHAFAWSATRSNFICTAQVEIQYALP